jgi:hypothetical protein
MPLDFTRFFQSAFKDERQPYDYQSRLISIPTGLGKKTFQYSYHES